MRLVPLSSDTYRIFTVCPWKAHAHNNLGFAPEPGPASDPSLEVRHLLGHALRGRLTPEQALQRGASREAADLLARTLADDPVPVGAEQLIDQYAAVDEYGRLVTTDPDSVSERVVAHGTVDRIVLHGNGEMSVTAWTSGYNRSEDPFERHLCAGLLARALFPDTRVVEFIKHDIRTAVRSSWVYTFHGRGSSVSVQGPRGRPSLLHDEDGPLVAYLIAVLRRIEAAEPKPLPGEHCLDWNGSRCRFLAAECPLGPSVSAVIDGEIRPMGQDSAALSLRGIASDPDVEILPDQASWAWNGVLQLEHFLGRVKKRLKTWAEENGPIHVGDDRYGWASKTENVVDTTAALQFMLDAKMPLEAVCQAINISKTSIERLPKQFHHIRQALLGTAVTPRQGKPRFGLMER
ncbi:MAG: hypothetical protein V1792_29530 [Pseudomonadota bacterium]